MSRLLRLLLFPFLFIQLTASAQAPTTPSSNVSFTSVDGDRFSISWSSGNGARRIIVMRSGAAVTAVPANGTDYNADASFGNGDEILPGQFVVSDNSFSSIVITNLSPATIYHVAIFEYNGTASSTQYLTASFAIASQSTVSVPTVQAGALSFSTIIGNSMQVTWANGDGQRRLLLVRQGSPVNTNPVDLMSYNANPLFGVGSNVGGGNYVVYSSTGNNVTVSGLQPSTTYHFALFEYNGSSGPVYLVPGATANAVTLARPTVATTNLVFLNADGDRMTLSWTGGNGTRRIVVARAGLPVTALPADGTDYTANMVFGSGDAVQPGEFVVYDGSSSSMIVTGLAPNTVYHYRVYEYDGAGMSTAYLTSSFASGSRSTAITPTVQAGNLAVTNLTGNSATISWVAGDGSGRLLVARQGSAVNSLPQDATSYNASPSFGSGTQLGSGNYSIYQSTGASVNVTNLQPNTTYFFELFEYNGSSAPVFLRPGATISLTTPSQPTIASGNMAFASVDGDRMTPYWTPGNGTRRIVIARAGAAVTAVPVDGIDYTASATFGNGDAILPGEFVVYDNVGGAGGFGLGGLQPATNYHFRIFEYNGSGTATSYLTSSFATSSQATLSAPATQASAINLTNVSGSTARINWTNGSGAARLVLLKAGSPVDVNPVNLVSYTGNSAFGSGTQIGSGNYAVLAGNGTGVTVTNLVPSTTYHLAIFEYNGSNGPVYLLPPAVSSFVTAPQPTVAATNLQFTAVDADRMVPFWTAGNGSRRIMIARAAAPVTAMPVNGTDYSASSTFGNGDEVAPGQFVVYDNTGGPGGFTLAGLTPGTVYHFAVFEYDGTGTSIGYLTSSFLSGSQATVGAPTIQASNLSFTSVTATSAVVNWTNGNGAGRMIVGRQGSAVNANPVNLTSYTANTSFGSGGQLGSGNFVIANTSLTNAQVTGLTSGTTYHFAVYEYNGASSRVYMVPGAQGAFTTPGPPQVQATAVTAGNITASSLQLNWINGSGNRRLVLMKAVNPVDALPVDNGTYAANSFFGSGTQLGAGNYVVNNSTGNGVLVTGLSSGTTYHFAVYEYNSFGATSQFIFSSPAVGSASTLSVLPVSFTAFTASNSKNNIRLDWSTAHEANSDYFEIQKSSNNTGNDFIMIGTVTAAGESNVKRHYSFVDDAPFEGVTYYRIRQVDRDGNFMYSRTLSVHYKPDGLIKKSLNPVRHSIFVQLTHFTPDASNRWTLYDMAGRVIHSQSFSQQTIYGLLPSLIPGMYILEVQMLNQSERLKIIKTD